MRDEFISVGFFVVVVLTLVGRFIIALRFFARPLVTPMGERGGGKMDFGEMESTRSTMRLVRVCDLRRGLVGGVWWNLVGSYGYE